MKSKNYFYYYYFNKINFVDFIPNETKFHYYEKLINLYKDKKYIELLIYLSKQKNSLEEIKFLINKYKFDNYDFNWAMAYASLNNYKELVDYFINKGAREFNLAMQCAIYNNYKELVEYLKEKQEEYNKN